MNKIRTWSQGYFVDSHQYDHWSSAMKQNADQREKHLVRPGPTENAICHCDDPEMAKWIAERLNLAAILEENSEE